MKSSGRTTTSDEIESVREANNKSKCFDVLDIVQARIRGFTEEELRKMESFSERGGADALAQGGPPVASTTSPKEEAKEQESKKIEAGVQGTQKTKCSLWGF
ncbi:expressed unknown protein [Seminavis robusta]|uniref:Uncharacterized protein n=1 Tax=Seminavis robusta TaxID=568900 RepID=A0A9N8H364_9STRA|nr:expressed unknown protein [Seminavis robusta]|eukprot:Sro52_g031080.1 n/a (102) ;mRNA; r:92291-92596